MTRVDHDPCWVVLAPLPMPELEEAVAAEWWRAVPYAVDPPPWLLIPLGSYGAVVSVEPGTEGPDRALAARCSLLVAPRPVYSLLLNPDGERICTWVAGDLASETDADPRPLAESLGLQLPQRRTPPLPASVAVIEGAPMSTVRQVLADLGAADWVQLTPSRRGVLVSSDSGPLGTQAWDVAEALPEARVYYVQRQTRPEAFSVLVLSGTEEVGWFRTPPLDDDTPSLPDILGASTPVAILGALDIPASAL